MKEAESKNKKLQYDVLVIGAGVIGSAVARELSRYALDIAVLEKHPDLCLETSGRNSGVLHAGFNNKPGSLMAKFCVQGNREFDTAAAELDVPYKRTGKLVVGFDEADRVQLLQMKETGDKNGVPGLEIVDETFIREKAPNVRGRFALWSPSTAVLSPFQYTIGLAENAAQNGVQYYFDSKVTNITQTAGSYEILAGGRRFSARWLVNCAGLGAAEIARLTGFGEYEIYPCRGEYFVFDPNLGPLLPLPAYPVPSAAEGGLGIHLTPSIDGNIMVGPSSEYIAQADDYACTRPIMDLLIEDGSRIFPFLDKTSYIRNFSGIRPKLTAEGGFSDFVVKRSEDAPYSIQLLGIESPGLTSALPIAGEVLRLIQEIEPLAYRDDFSPVRKGIVSFHDKTPEQKAALIAQNPDYGEVICRCNEITKAEVVAALSGALPARTMAGVKYRCRTMMGRCQGGYCQARVADLLMELTGKSREEILLAKDGSYLFTGEVRP